MLEVSFILVFIVLLAAAVTDIKRREVPDWLSYSFIAAALAIAMAKSIVLEDYSPVLNSLSGLAVFFIIACIFYYGKLFAGGDAKLLIGTGAALGIDYSFLANLILAGGVYGMAYAFVLAAINLKKVSAEIRRMKMPLILPLLAIAVVLALAGLISEFSAFYFLAVLAGLTPALYYSTLAVEKIALIKSVSPDNLTEGDWLLRDVEIGRTVIKANFEGLSKKDIQLIKKAKKNVMIKYGLPFVPVFLIAFIAELALGNLLLIILGF